MQTNNAGLSMYRSIIENYPPVARAILYVNRSPSNVNRGKFVRTCTGVHYSFVYN